MQENILVCSSKRKISVTPSQAPHMCVEAVVTICHCEIIRTTASKIYPCYSVLQNAKIDCLPAKESFCFNYNLHLQALPMLVEAPFFPKVSIKYLIRTTASNTIFLLECFTEC